MEGIDLLKESRDLIYKLKESERAYFNAVKQLSEARHVLLEKQCEVYNDGKVKGKNDLTRNAELWPHTKELQKQVLKAEADVDDAKAAMYFYRRSLDTIHLALQLSKQPEETRGGKHYRLRTGSRST